ncbi:hydrogenase formation protein HypD [Caldichromatium japonicum]|uniref:Hydrogenase maturation factor n=1 Tax=Caldichromatium japonicum TaxID=2699430 RepID=A0A6G7VDB3_9GAMM|nr:hydrogenase formation protein HypD [Caldichromatium japonicum]QIK37875.1 hydrogenase formation protein HypD [Caldichromatium japonicum]
MNYLDAFRDPGLAHSLAAAIAAETDPVRPYRLMEFCGGHTHAIVRSGLQQLLPPNVRFVHGPGCPVCVLSIARLDQAIAMALAHGVILCTYGDLMRVPASHRQSLLKAKAAGADVRMIYSTQDVLRIARAEPSRQVVFMAIGFETTAPATAVAVLQAQAEGLSNLSFLCNHVLTPPALRAILAEPGPEGVQLDGIIGPAHVSTIIGSRPYAFVPREFHIPLVIAGFEPLDVMQAALMLIRRLNAGQSCVENQYRRAVSEAGNIRALEFMSRVFVIRPSFEWRGLGTLPASALALGPEFAAFDAEQRFPVEVNNPTAETKGCECPAILRGLKEPTDCRLFGTACTPEHPLGACMVSSEGACAAYWSYGRSAGRGSSGQRAAAG